MSAITRAIYSVLVSDDQLAALLASYGGLPAVFTVDPAPGDAQLPFIVTAGETGQSPWDTKLTRGREVWRDVRCYAPASGSAELVEAMAERVRELFHREAIEINGFRVVMLECTGPRGADEQDVYGRIISLHMLVEEV